MIHKAALQRLFKEVILLMAKDGDLSMSHHQLIFTTFTMHNFTTEDFEDFQDFEEGFGFGMRKGQEKV